MCVSGEDDDVCVDVVLMVLGTLRRRARWLGETSTRVMSECVMEGVWVKVWVRLMFD